MVYYMEHTDINGVINVLKPPGMTSHDVVNFIRRTLKTKKAGHTGTLDPGVAGVLPVCVGKATKIIEYISHDIKQYRAELTLGRSTDTQDGFGETIAEFDASGISLSSVTEAINSLRGEIQQVPPMVSALKFKGRKLYELARQGIEVEREPRKVHIFETRIIKCQDFGTPNPRMLFDVSCSKGTYVRTICHDLGNSLGCGGYMSFLVRTGAGIFKIEESLTVEEITEVVETGGLNEIMMSISEVLPLKQILVYDNVGKSISHGNRVYTAGVINMPEDLEENQIVKLINTQNQCLAIAKVINEANNAETDIEHRKYVFQPIKVLF